MCVRVCLRACVCVRVCVCVCMCVCVSDLAPPLLDRNRFGATTLTCGPLRNPSTWPGLSRDPYSSHSVLALIPICN